MKDRFMKLLKESIKNGKNADKDSKDYSAKADILAEMKALMDDTVGDKMKGLKKITVASDTVDGLKTGLDKAEDVLEAKEEMEGDDDLLSKLKKIAADKVSAE